MHTKSDELYTRLLFHGPSEALRELNNEEHEIDSPCTVAVVYAMAKDFSKSEETSKIASSRTLDNPSDRSRCLEAAMIRSIVQGGDPEELAVAAIGLDQHAAFANRFLGHQHLRHKEFDAALANFDMVLEAYPDHGRTLLDRAAALALAKNRPEALQSAHRAPASIRRLLYSVIIRSLGIGRIVSGLLIALPILFFPSPWIPFFLFSFLFLALIAFSIRSGDELIFGTSIAWEVQAVSFLIVRLAISLLFGAVVGD